jgi:hypothetical protein
MRKLMSQDRFDLHGAQACQCGDRKQHHRFQPSHDRWSADQRRLDDVDGASQVKTRR